MYKLVFLAEKFTLSVLKTKIVGKFWLYVTQVMLHILKWLSHLKQIFTFNAILVLKFTKTCFTQKKRLIQCFLSTFTLASFLSIHKICDCSKTLLHVHKLGGWWKMFYYLERKIIKYYLLGLWKKAEEIEDTWTMF